MKKKKIVILAIILVLIIFVSSIFVIRYFSKNKLEQEKNVIDKAADKIVETINIIPSKYTIETVEINYDGVIDVWNEKGLIKVVKNEKQGIIDKEGKQIIECKYDNIHEM